MITPKFPSPWTPQQDVEQALQYSDPVTQNRAIINAARETRTGSSMLPAWADYYDVLKGRNAHIQGGLEGMGANLPAGYTPDQLQNENYDYLTSGAAPRYADSESLPGSQNAIRQSMGGLRKAMGIK